MLNCAHGGLLASKIGAEQGLVAELTADRSVINKIVALKSTAVG